MISFGRFPRKATPRLRRSVQVWSVIALTGAMSGCSPRTIEQPPVVATAPAVQPGPPQAAAAPAPAPSSVPGVQTTGVSQANGSAPHLIAYLFAGKKTNYTELSQHIKFGKVTELYLAFADPPKCAGVCTADSDMHFAIDGESDADIDRMVGAAHAVGVKVVVSIGGGGGV